MQTIQYDQNGQKINDNKNNKDNRSVGSKSQSRDKVIHSAFQVHKMYSNTTKPKPPTLP